MKWLDRLFRKRKLETQIDSELRFHVEQKTAELIAQGVEPVEARRRATAKLGGIEAIKQEWRESRAFYWLESLLRDIRYAFRTLRKSPSFTIVAVLILALGIGANTAMFSIIYAALVRPLPFRDPGRLVLASVTFGGAPNPTASAPDYYDYRAQADGFEALSAILGWAPKTTITGGAEPERAAFTYISDDFFRTLGVQPAAGRSFTPAEGRSGSPDVVMVSTRLARRRFGDLRRAVGASLAVNGRLYTVVGVVPASFRFLFDVDLWFPMRRGESIAGAARQFHNWLIVGRLKPGVSIENAQSQVDVISKRLEQEYPASDTGMALRLDPLQAALVGPQEPRLLLLMAAVGLVLLIACANVAGLLLARGSVRRLELAVRATLGASRARIARQLLVESMTLALLSGVLGVVLALWLSGLLPLVTGLGNPTSAPKGLGWPMLVFALTCSVAAGVLFGVAPALRASSVHLVQDLAPGSRATSARLGTSLRSALVVGQVAVSVVLLVGAGLLIRSLAHLAAANPGFEAQHLLTGEIQLLANQYPKPSQRDLFFDGLREDLAAVPGVKGVGFISGLPLRDPGGNWPAWNTAHPPAEPANRPLAYKRIVLPGYFGAMRIPLLSGRDFGNRDRQNAPLTMVINQLMARTLFASRNPLGQRVSVDLGGSTPTVFEVVGVVGNARINFIGHSAPMTMYMSYYQFPEATLRFAIRTRQDPTLMTRAVRKVVRARNPDIPVEKLESMEAILGDSVAPQQVTAVTLTAYALVALLLASIGLYGVLAYSVSQRMHEVGIRMALGAERRDIFRLVVGQGMILSLTGLGIGIVGALGLTRFLSSMLYGVVPNDPPTFASISLLVAGVALLACSIPAWRAMRVDPMVALRHE